MQITKHTDYALRLLMHVAVLPERTTIRDAADTLGVSRNHLVKITTRLGELGYLELARGNGGGVSLGRDPKDITVGAIFRALENSILVECFQADESKCAFTGNCALEATLRSALECFFDRLDQVTIADLVGRGRRRLLATGRARG